MRLAATLLTLLAAAQALPAQPGPPNILLILADDLGYGDLSVYGGWIQTPQLERLAREGVRLTDFHASAPICSPTRAGLLTGRYQQRAGIPGVVYADPQNPVHHHGLQPGEITFPKLLRERGYATALMGKWHLGYLPRYHPARHGFDFFRGYLSGNVDYFSKVDQAGSYDWWHDEQAVQEEGYVTHLITAHALEFIEKHRDRPFCLYVAHEAPHYPYQGPQDRAFRSVGSSQVRQDLAPEQIRRAYRSMVVEMDRGIGQILDRLAELGLQERTFVFFFSDNGATRQGSNGLLRGYKGQLWEGGHRVPALARFPGQLPADGVCSQLAISLDLMPTILALARVEPPEGHRLDGINLLPFLRGEEPARERTLFWEFRGRAMRQGPWKLLLDEPGLEGPALYRLDKDLFREREPGWRVPRESA